MYCFGVGEKNTSVKCAPFTTIAKGDKLWGAEAKTFGASPEDILGGRGAL